MANKGFHLGKGITNETPLKWILLLPALPISALASLYGLVIFVRIRLGYWPTPMHPDPKYIYISYVIWYLLTFVFVLVYIVTSVIYLYKTRDRTLKAETAVLWVIIGFLFWYLYIYVLKNDPGRYIEWIFD